MCGVAGFTFGQGLPPDARRARHGETIRRMTAALRHRGPDAQRALLLDGCALGHARLAIIDLAGGAQPMRDPDTGVTIAFNGEIFNYLELRRPLEARHRFRTSSDTEVLLAAFLARGIDCLRDLVGQFAFAIWDPRAKALWLARDHFGIAPMFYAEVGGQLAFASEAKALFAGGHMPARLDGRGVKQSVQLWAPLAPRTCFEGVRALPAAHYACWRDGALSVHPWWELDLGAPPEPDAGAMEKVEALLDDAVRLRLRADVPVAAYLSGGLDSSLTSAMAQRRLQGTLSTFSVSFEDPTFDEGAWQRTVAEALGTRHTVARIAERDVAALLPDTIWHGEQVTVRAAPAPLLRLSRLVKESKTKVVLTGEGADEMFLGYDLYREAKIRRFWARQPASQARPALLSRIYGFLKLGRQGADMLRPVFGAGLDQPDAPGFSHLVRWNAAGRIARFFAPAFAESVADEHPVESVVATMPERVRRWPVLARAQWLELKTLLAGYLISAQGDRMLLGSGVEGRFPFLDHRLAELAARLPARVKLRGLREKAVLRDVAARWLPAEVRQRPKYPYRSPIGAAALAGPEAPAETREALGREALAASGLFEPAKVEALLAKMTARPTGTSEADFMALSAITSAQLLWSRFRAPPALPSAAVAAVDLEVA